MNMVYENILVAIDGSKEAEWAFRKAVSIAKRNHAHLMLCTIIDSREVVLTSYGLPIEPAFIEHAENFSHSLLTKYKNTAIENGLSNVETIIEYGSPKVKIAKEIAPEKNVDLIVCGATGMNAVERIFVGSVSEHILRYANCDVLIVRTEKEED
ncbi:MULTISPECIES: universal stress protein [Bacillaceae]|uniref:Universal stress protein n=1 Tax=Metabacillus endolithicus TaxID=1535204 RepID=A0ABW5BSQ0_9BACI|nr:universal stress protein [Bacillus sp. AFS040349]PGT84435.1 universal stress protein UspA [Bacillus sp. AFS040349]